MRNPFANVLHRQTLSVALPSLGGELLNVVFFFYYVKVFLNLYHLEQKWINIAQILFMVWNAINDPLFGFIQDFGCGSSCKWISKRRKVILYCGPIYCVTFMIPWLPWSWGVPNWLVGLHLIVSLFFFDALLSLVLSAHCGMITELTTQHKGRVRVVVYLETASLIASFVIFPVDKLSKNLDDFRAFQVCCAVVAVLASVCFIVSGITAPKEVAQIVEMSMNEAKSSNQDAKEPGNPENCRDLAFWPRTKAALVSAREILSNRDFWSVVVANFFHIMRNLANANFLTIFTEALISPNGVLPKGSVQLSLFYTAANVLPKLFLAMCWPLLNRFGPWFLTMGTIILTFVNSTVAYFVGRHLYSGLAVFFLVENILARSLWPAVYNIFFPDIIDEDMKLNQRKNPLSTLIYTMNALFTKPAISIAPIIITAFLSSANYQTYNKWTQARGNDTLASFQFSPNSTLFVANEGEELSMTGAEANHLFDVMFTVACFFPMVCGALEACALTPYRLKMNHKRDDDVQTCANVL